MDRDTELRMDQLKAIIACDQSDGLLKEWARNELAELERTNQLSSEQEKLLVAVG